MSVKTPLVDATRIAKITGIREDNIRRLTRQGRLLCYRYGYYVRYDEGKAIEAINDHEKGN